MVAAVSPFTLWRGSWLAPTVPAVLTLIVFGQPVTALLVFGAVLLLRRILRVAAPLGGLQPPLASWGADLPSGGHDPMASNRWQPAPPPSRPMGPPGLR